MGNARGPRRSRTRNREREEELVKDIESRNWRETQEAKVTLKKEMMDSNIKCF